jgi:hypothetical protein
MPLAVEQFDVSQYELGHIKFICVSRKGILSRSEPTAHQLWAIRRSEPHGILQHEYPLGSHGTRPRYQKAGWRDGFVTNNKAEGFAHS